jgi:hypothetical protein
MLALCSPVKVYWRIRDSYCRPNDRGSEHLWNVDEILQDDMAQHVIRQSPSTVQRFSVNTLPSSDTWIIAMYENSVWNVTYCNRPVSLQISSRILGLKFSSIPSAASSYVFISCHFVYRLPARHAYLYFPILRPREFVKEVRACRLPTVSCTWMRQVWMWVGTQQISVLMNHLVPRCFLSVCWSICSCEESCTLLCRRCPKPIVGDCQRLTVWSDLNDRWHELRKTHFPHHVPLPF